MGVSDGKERGCFVAGAVIQLHGPCGAVTGTDEKWSAQRRFIIEVGRAARD